jgi:lipoyl(octanoyl) transferase
VQPSVQFQWIRGHSYQDVWDLQTQIHQQLVKKKLDKRSLPLVDQQQLNQKHQLLFCEHNPVFTLGKSGSMDHLLLSEDELSSDKIEFFKINRGGDITYHGPGQITGYPIFDLDEFFTDVHKYVRLIEEVIIRLLSMYGLSGVRVPAYTGVWLAPDQKSDKYRKICAIGVHLSRWVSMHGFAFNVNTDLTYFDKIIPCGIVDENKAVTSLSKETGLVLDINEVGEQLKSIFSELFDYNYITNEKQS